MRNLRQSLLANKKRMSGGTQRPYSITTQLCFRVGIRVIVEQTAVDYERSRAVEERNEGGANHGGNNRFLEVDCCFRLSSCYRSFAFLWAQERDGLRVRDVKLKTERGGGEHHINRLWRWNKPIGVDGASSWLHTNSVISYFSNTEYDVICALCPMNHHTSSNRCVVFRFTLLITATVPSPQESAITIRLLCSSNRRIWTYAIPVYSFFSSFSFLWVPLWNDSRA